MNEITTNNQVPAPANTGGEKVAEDAPTIPISMNYRLALEQIARLTGDMQPGVESEPGEPENKSPNTQQDREEN